MQNLILLAKFATMEEQVSPNDAVARRIKEIREKKGITQKHLATAVGLTVAAYSRIECGQTQITVNNLFIIANTLGTTIEILLGLSEKNIANNIHNIVMSNFNSGHIHIDIDASEMLDKLRTKPEK